MDLALACLWATDRDRRMQKKVGDENADQSYGRETWNGGREAKMKIPPETPER